MTSDIVTAEVVEVERPRRPERFVAFHDFESEHDKQDFFCSRDVTAEKAIARLAKDCGCPADYVVRIPAEGAPAAATRGADAVEIEAAFRQMAENAAYYNGMGMEMDGKTLNGRPLWESYLTPKAREVLAALKGA